jgi:hypothetical protein
MIKSTLITGNESSPNLVFTATTTGAPAGGSILKQTSAITTMILCNIGTPTITDESVNAATVTIHLVRDDEEGIANSNKIVSKLNIPAGETVFFSDEKIILDGGDEIWIGASTSNLISVTVSSLPV